MTSGVPQGPILGPLLFVCYVNDMPKYCTEMRPFLYVDDTELLVKGKSVFDKNTKLEKNVYELLKWFAENKLSIKASKKKWVHRSCFHGDKLSIVSGDVSIENIDTR